jgi:hypothetical protein
MLMVLPVPTKLAFVAAEYRSDIILSALYWSLDAKGHILRVCHGYSMNIYLDTSVGTV